MSHGDIDDNDSAASVNLNNDYVLETSSSSPTSLNITDGMATLSVHSSYAGCSHP